jgi:phosphoglucosamine mutase
MCALDYKARGRLARNMVAVTSMSNMGLHDAMRTGGIRVTVTDVGDRQVIERMRADGLNLGGEKSGHVIYMDYATTGDGIITALQVLKLMKQTGKTIRQLGACMEEYPHALKNVPVAEKRPLAELKKVSRAIAECNRTLAGRGRVLVRYSGTERILRVLVEARTTAQVQRWTNRIAAAAATELGVRKA